MLLVVIAMQGRIGGVGWAKKIHPFAVSVGALVCIASLAAPFIMPRAGLSFMMAYSNLITVYQWIAAGYITLLAGLTIWKQSFELPLFRGMLILDSTLAMDYIRTPFEPILTGWFPELGSFALVVSLGDSCTRNHRQLP